MNRLLIGFAAILLTATVASSALGQCNCVKVIRYALDGTPESNPAEWPLGLSTNISTTVGNNISKVVVRAEPTTGAIGKVTVNGDSTEVVWVLVTTDINQGSVGLPPSAGSSWAGLDDNRGYLRLRAGITQNLTSDIYLNDTSDIQFLRVDGEIQDSVRIGGTGSTIATNVQAGAIAAAGDATKLAGRIASVLVNNGNALGDIKAVAGSIGTIDVTAGSIGASGQPVAIEAAAADSGEHILRVNASQHIYANVDCNTSTTQVDGVIRTFFAGNGASPSTTGDFHGTMRLNGFTEQVTIVRDCYGSIDYGGALPAGSQSQPKEIIIGRSLKSGAQVNFPSGGLQGLVGINRIQGAGGVWESGATVNVGPTALTAYNYAQTAASIGGASAGLISYRLHDPSCSPVNGGTALTSCSTYPAVRLRHYGPLQWNTGAGAPATVSRRLACGGGSFTTVTTSTSNFALDDDNPSANEPQRTLVVTLPFDVGYEYKITPTSNLKSVGDGSGNPSVVWDGDYLFTVWPACYADVVATGTVDIDDLLAVIGAWGSCPTPPTACPADIMPLACGNDAVDIDDLLAVISAYGPCASCDDDEESEGARFGGASSPPEIDWEYFTDCLTNGTPEEQEACLAELAELLAGS